jgi:hypothetical protein
VNQEPARAGEVCGGEAHFSVFFANPSSLKALAVFQAFNLAAALQNREFQGGFPKN